MYALQSLVSLPLLALAVRATPFHYAREEQTSQIKWEECDLAESLNATVPVIDCGSLVVPLDYTTNRPNETLTLSLQRVPASKSPKLGSILLNFGGPGADGVEDLAVLAERMQAATGGYHDLINVVPRGTGKTLPFSCYPDPVSRLLAPADMAGNASDAALGRVWAEASLFSDACYATQNKTGELLGTAFVARDFMHIVDALGEDGLLRYWGVSYGTVLGSTLAAMFPDRIDKLVNDGVVNPHEYYSNTEVELFTDTDAAFSGFCAGCVARPDNCPLAQNYTAQQLEDTIYAFIDDIKYNPFPLGGVLVDYEIVKGYIAYQLYFPQGWADLALVIYAVMLRDESIGEVLGTGGTGETASNDAAEARFGIKCGDVLYHSQSLDEKREQFAARGAISRIAGDGADGLVARCSQWRMPAKERYDGDFDVHTRNPMLIIGNTYDPVTPLASARNLSQTIETSVLLQQDTYGHDSLMIGSLCTAKAIRSYFVHGVLPEEGTVCESHVELFADTDKSGWVAIIEELEADPLEV